MASRKLEDLDEAFRARYALMIGGCHLRGVTLLHYCTLRDPLEQARHWRRSRPRAVVERQIATLRRQAPFLAACLEAVGPQPSGPWATGSVPGLSWHQWGMAADACPLDARGKPIWSADAREYEIMAEEAIRQGLDAGLYWRKRDAVHVQMHRGGVTSHYSMSEINDLMEQRFSHLLQGATA